MPDKRKVSESAKKDIRSYFGTSGSGKSHQIKQAIKTAPRVLIFDPEGEYKKEGFTAFDSPLKFAEAVQKNTTKPMRYALEANGAKAFDIFCRVVWWERCASAPLVCVVDELAGVTTTAKAPGAWHSILTRGRKYKLSVRAGAQSPTEIDKTLMRQRSHLWVGYMTRGDDWAYMAKETGLDVATFQGLRPGPHFDSVTIESGKPHKLNKK